MKWEDRKYKKFCGGGNRERETNNLILNVNGNMQQAPKNVELDLRQNIRSDNTELEREAVIKIVGAKSYMERE